MTTDPVTRRWRHAFVWFALIMAAVAVAALFLSARAASEIRNRDCVIAAALHRPALARELGCGP